MGIEADDDAGHIRSVAQVSGHLDVLGTHIQFSGHPRSDARRRKEVWNR